MTSPITDDARVPLRGTHPPGQEDGRQRRRRVNRLLTITSIGGAVGLALVIGVAAPDISPVSPAALGVAAAPPATTAEADGGDQDGRAFDRPARRADGPFDDGDARGRGR